MQESRNLMLIFLFQLFMIANITGQQQDSVAISIQTSIGEIHAILFPAKAPITCSNFLGYIDLVGNNGGQFYRTVKPDNQPGRIFKIEVIQGGFNLGTLDTSQIQPIQLERTKLTGILHEDGTLSMARDDPDSGSSEFFICIGNQPSLDFGGGRNPDGQGFAAFGKVIRGMDIVRKIQLSPSVDQSLIPPINILKISKE